MGDLANLAVKKEIIEKKGAWFYYKDYKWNGVKNVVSELEENEKLRKDIIKMIKG